MVRPQAHGILRIAATDHRGAYGIGVLLTSVGVIIYVASMFKSEAGFGLTIGGVMLFILPLVLPRYLGVECIPQ